ncbi:MAG: nucleoside hydrolase [Caulobacteraceae bacterium]
MNPRPLIIDCDPGVDDAIALLLALACPEALEVLAVTTVGGNVDAAQTARNACIVRQLAGREDVPVYRGAEAPLARDPVEAVHFHGATGLGDLQTFAPEAGPAPGRAADAIVRLVMARPPRALTLAVTGPLTNLALALRQEPAIAARLGPVVVMGGARAEGGNITASAEYNIHADPHAAEEVLAAGLDLTLIGLDATHQVRATPQRVKALAAVPTASARTAAALLDFAYRTQLDLVGWDSPPLHDPCTIAFLLQPELFETAPASIRVEAASPLTLGHTAVEFRIDAAHPANARWAVKADGQGVFALLQDRLARR